MRKEIRISVSPKLPSCFLQCLVHCPSDILIQLTEVHRPHRIVDHLADLLTYIRKISVIHNSIAAFLFLRSDFLLLYKKPNFFTMNFF